MLQHVNLYIKTGGTETPSGHVCRDKPRVADSSLCEISSQVSSARHLKHCVFDKEIKPVSGNRADFHKLRLLK